jgi:hypothetical protein
MSVPEIGSVILAVVFTISGAVKLSGSKAALEIGTKVGASLGLLRFVGACELLAAVGLVAGVVLDPWMAITASIGLVLLMVGAIGAHLRVKEPFTASLPAIVLGVVAAALVFSL